MSHSTIDIERVVREVLAELNAAPKAEGGGRKAEKVAGGQSLVASQSQISNLKSQIPNPSPLGELILSDRVVTMAQLTGRLNVARRVVVSHEAIVTPAVRDELIRRGIALECVDSTGGQTTPIRLAMIVTGADFDPAALVAVLTRDGLRVEHSTSDCIIASTEQLAAEVAGADTLGVLLTRYTAAGLCLANRLAGVRAIAGSDASAVAAASAAVGANVLVADPRAGTFFQLKQMVTEFSRGGVRHCPAVFHAKLA
jgi:hypothetical protein